MKKHSVVLGVCASIAAYRACEVINRLRKEKIEVTVCMSRDAEKFITPLTLQTLSGNRVFKDMFEALTEWDPLHISLSKKAELILVVPATSDFISRVAAGICDDLLSCVIASARSPVVFAPAMNEAMYNHRILQSNITRLKKLGYHFIGPIEGPLACGERGLGHIADTDDIIKKVKTLLK